MKFQKLPEIFYNHIPVKKVLWLSMSCPAAPRNSNPSIPQKFSSKVKSLSDSYSNQSYKNKPSKIQHQSREAYWSSGWRNCRMGRIPWKRKWSNHTIFERSRRVGNDSQRAASQGAPLKSYGASKFEKRGPASPCIMDRRWRCACMSHF